MTAHAHHDNVTDVPIHSLLVADVTCGCVLLLGLIDGTCAIFMFPEQHSSSSSAAPACASSSSRLVTIRRIAVG
jgi:hypothetical protein